MINPASIYPVVLCACGGGRCGKSLPMAFGAVGGGHTRFSLALSMASRLSTHAPFVGVGARDRSLVEAQLDGQAATLVLSTDHASVLHHAARSAFADTPDALLLAIRSDMPLRDLAKLPDLLTPWTRMAEAGAVVGGGASDFGYLSDEERLDHPAVQVVFARASRVIDRLRGPVREPFVRARRASVEIAWQFA